MATLEDVRAEAKKLIVPAAASIAGAGAGLVLTRKPVRNALPNLGDLDVGDLMGDLRDKVSSLGERSASLLPNSESQPRKLDAGELERRRAAREQRRSQRRARS